MNCSWSQRSGHFSWAIARELYYCWLLMHCLRLYSLCVFHVSLRDEITCCGGGGEGRGGVIWWEFMWLDCTYFKISFAWERLTAGTTMPLVWMTSCCMQWRRNCSFLRHNFHWRHYARYTSARSNGALEINALKGLHRNYFRIWLMLKIVRSSGWNRQKDIGLGRGWRRGLCSVGRSVCLKRDTRLFYAEEHSVDASGA